MPTDWDAVATALAESPAVLAFDMAPAGTSCLREGREKRWLSLLMASGVVTCRDLAGEVECRARPEGEDFLGCFGWDKLLPGERPVEAEALLELWTASPQLDAWTPPRPGSAPTTPEVISERDGETRLALHVADGWALTSAPVAPPGRGFRVEPSESFDASKLLDHEAWGVVTSYFDGCGQGGTTDWSLLIFRREGPWLHVAATRTLGATSFDGDDDGGRTRFWGARLNAKVTPAGMLHLRVEHDRGGETAVAVRHDAGLWRIEDGEFRRGPAPKP